MFFPLFKNDLIVPKEEGSTSMDQPRFPCIRFASMLKQFINIYVEIKKEYIFYIFIKIEMKKKRSMIIYIFVCYFFFFFAFQSFVQLILNLSPERRSNNNKMETLHAQVIYEKNEKSVKRRM